MTQAAKGERFRALHQRDRAFIIPNPWDVGTARILERLGFEALATTSSGFAFSVGRRDNTVSRDDAITHVAAMVSSTDLPINADLENGFGDDPEACAETIRLAAAAGAVGGSIEDSTGRSEGPIYCIEHAAARVRAAVEAARSLPFTFTVVARAENFLHGRTDLADTIRRLQAFQEVGADVLYAPGLSTKDDIAAVVRSVDRPVNVLMGFQSELFTLDELSALGVKRVSVGGALCRAAVGAFLRAAREMQTHGTFEWARQAVSSRELSEFLG